MAFADGAIGPRFSPASLSGDRSAPRGSSPRAAASRPAGWRSLGSPALTITSSKKASTGAFSTASAIAASGVVAGRLVEPWVIGAVATLQPAAARPGPSRRPSFSSRRRLSPAPSTASSGCCHALGWPPGQRGDGSAARRRRAPRPGASSPPRRRARPARHPPPARGSPARADSRQAFAEEEASEPRVLRRTPARGRGDRRRATRSSGRPPSISMRITPSAWRRSANGPCRRWAAGRCRTGRPASPALSASATATPVALRAARRRQSAGL